MVVSVSHSTEHSAERVSSENRRWKRMIALMDMNAFFASVEQLDRPDWQGRPVAITNGSLGSTIITCSYEARAWGACRRVSHQRLKAHQLLKAINR